MSPGQHSNLFQPVQLGNIQLLNRIVLAPLTRFRGTDAHVPGPEAAKYYAQRASTPGTLLITEGTYPRAKDGGYPNVPGKQLNSPQPRFMQLLTYLL